LLLKLATAAATLTAGEDLAGRVGRPLGDIRTLDSTGEPSVQK
jgi:hypothetical protein